MDSGIYSVRRPVENVYLVRERDRVRTREFMTLLVAALPPLAVFVFAVWSNMSTFKLGYQIENLQRKREALLETRRRLRLSKAALASVARVEPIARRQGLVAPRSEQLILLRDLGQPASESPADAFSTPRAWRNVPSRLSNAEFYGPEAPSGTEEGF